MNTNYHIMKKILPLLLGSFLMISLSFGQNSFDKTEVEKQFKEENLDKSDRLNKAGNKTKGIEPTEYVKGSSEVIIDENTSEAEAVKKAKELARINAIESKFGRLMIQGNSVYIENLTTGEKVESSTKFNSISDSYVKGEWVADDKVDCKIVSKNSVRWCNCEISGLVRPLKDMPLQFKSEPLNCEDWKKCRTTQFSDGGSLFLYFNSSASGYMSVFLTDMDNAQCLLPYPKQTDKLFQIEANREHVLFSEKTAPESFRSFVEHYELSTEKLTEENILYVIFSEKEFIKPVVFNASTEDKKEKLSNSEIQRKYELPKQTSAEDFMKWLAKLRIYNPEVQVQQIPITIIK